MKVYIGKYINWIGPYQIIDAIFFWQEKYPNDKLAARWDYRLSSFLGNWLSNTWLNDFCNWIHSIRKRTIIVKIDRYDAWSCDHTLSLIIVPLLKELQKQKQGAPFVEYEDVPKHLRPTPKQIEKFKESHDTDSQWFKRFEWVLGEMIWAHEQLLKDDDEDQFIIQRGEIDWTDYPEDEGKKTTPLRWKKRYVMDEKGLKAHRERVDNGLRLFGKYYRSLWD